MIETLTERRGRLVRVVIAAAGAAERVLTSYTGRLAELTHGPFYGQHVQAIRPVNGDLVERLPLLPAKFTGAEWAEDALMIRMGSALVGLDFAG